GVRRLRRASRASGTGRAAGTGRPETPGSPRTGRTGNGERRRRRGHAWPAPSLWSRCGAPGTGRRLLIGECREGREAAATQFPRLVVSGGPGRGEVPRAEPGSPARAGGSPAWGGREAPGTSETGRDDLDPCLCVLRVSEGGLEPPRPIKGTSTSS